MENNMIRKYLLQEYIEPDLSEPELFDSYEEAYEKMKEYFFSATDTTEEDYEEELASDFEDGDAGLDEWSAFCQNKNHDNCMWNISVLDISGDGSKSEQPPCEFCARFDFDSTRAIVKDGDSASLVHVGGMTRYPDLREGSQLRFCPVCGRHLF